MTGELDFFDTQVSTETLGADKEGTLGADKKGEKEKCQIRLFHFYLPVGVTFLFFAQRFNNLRHKFFAKRVFQIRHQRDGKLLSRN